MSARRTGTEHLIPNAFCVLNYTYVYRDKIAKPVNADYVSAGVQCTPLQLKTNVSIQLKASPDVGGAFKLSIFLFIKILNRLGCGYSAVGCRGYKLTHFL